MKKVKLYSLSSCTFCQAIKKMLTDLGIEHQAVDADLLEDSARSKLIDELKKINPKCSFPTVTVDDETIIGFKIQEIKEAIGIRTEVDNLFELLKKSQEAKGYYFNKDKERTFDLLRGLLTNKDRYGYMACPCRLASGDRKKDRDIICPCVYREPDVNDFGTCYCQLYVSSAWNDGDIDQVEVPERRPADKF